MPLLNGIFCGRNGGGCRRVKTLELLCGIVLEIMLRGGGHGLASAAKPPEGRRWDDAEFGGAREHGSCDRIYLGDGIGGKAIAAQGSDPIGDVARSDSAHPQRAEKWEGMISEAGSVRGERRFTDLVGLVRKELRDKLGDGEAVVGGGGGGFDLGAELALHLGSLGLAVDDALDPAVGPGIGIGIIDADAIALQAVALFLYFCDRHSRLSLGASAAEPADVGVAQVKGQ